MCFPLTMFVMETLAFVIDWRVTCLAFIISFILVGYFILKKDNKNSCIKALCWFIGITSLLIFIGANIYDASYDGQWYHSAVIRLMSTGWNPFYHAILSQSEMPYYTATNIWVSHYAKGMETIEAGIVAMTGNLESGKAVNLMFTTSLFCFIYEFLDKRTNTTGKFLKIIISLIITLNPILVNQVMTHYIDYTCYAFVVIGLICVYEILIKQEHLYVYVLFLMGFFIPSIKFNIVFWFVVILFVFMCGIYIANGIFDKKIFWKMIVVIIAGFIIGAFNPYITNTLYKHNPIYPLIGKGKVDIMSIVTPQKINGKNRFYQVNYSLIANPYSNDNRRHGKVTFFKITKEDLLDSPKHDLQLGGFGEFFFEALVILIVVFVLMKKNKKWKLMFASCSFLYICLFFLPTSFLVRYVPFFYLVPCILILYILNTCTEEAKYKKAFVYMASVLLLLDSAISLVGVVAINAQQRLQTDYIVQQIKLQKHLVNIRSESVQLYDKFDNAGCMYQNGNYGRNYTCGNQINLIGVKMQTNLKPSDFNVEDMPFIMKNMDMFQLKFSKIQK